MTSSPGFELASVKPLTLNRCNRLANMYVLSPFVWRDGDMWRILVRAVPRRDDEPRLKMAEVWHGASSDGLAASAVEHDGDIRIYYSQSDQDLRCATVRRT